MAKIYAVFTKCIWAVAILASLFAMAKEWIGPKWIFIGFIILLILTFPALAITDLSNQVEKLKKLVEASEKSNNIKDGYKRVQIIARAGYEIFEVNQKKFAVVKNGNPDPDTFYCPHCYSQVNPTSDSCYNCKYNFKEGIVQDNVTSSEAQDNTESKSNNLKDGYKRVEVNQKKFAVVKDGNPDNFYCPHCYSQVNPKSDSCYNCKHNFKEDIVQDDVTSSEAQNNVESESNSGEVWVCSKCGASNPIGTVLCRRCGQ